MALGGLLLWPRARVLAAWGIVLLLIAVFPANVFMYQARETAFHDIPTWILIARLPLQFALIAWALVYTRKPR
jgi:uncharacterized membrane protein